MRKRLADTRNGVTHKFCVGDQEGYFTVGLDKDNQPKELFIVISKNGSTLGGVFDAVGALTSIALQSGVPLKTLVHKMAFQGFAPAGHTRNPKIPYAYSILDYIFRWIGHTFIENYNEEEDKDPAIGRR